MNWRDPNKELPAQNQKVWVMLEPHKDRGSLLASAGSIQIVCGETCYSHYEVKVDNYDELGLGSITWQLKGETDYRYDEHRAIAWIPVEEMTYPSFYKGV